MRPAGLILLLFISYSCACAGNYYVSSEGSDKNPGTQDRPFRTIRHAVSFLSGGGTCYIMRGSYHEEIKLSGLSGTRNNPVVITNYQDQEVIMDGTLPIKGEWKLYRNNIYSIKIDKPVWQLFVDGKSISSARWPNGNWNDGSIWDKTKSMCWPEKGKGGLGKHYNEELKEFNFSLEDGGIIIVNSGSFKTYKSFITEHIPGSDHFNYNPNGVHVHFGYVGKVERFAYFLEGKKELIDVENEWFFEPADSMLYVYFEEGSSPDDHTISGKTISYAFDAEEAAHIVIKGIDFFASTVSFLNSSCITIEDCHFNFPSYSKRMLRDLSPIEVTRFLVKDEFTPSYDTIRNCIFAYMDGPALDMNGAGNVVENNYMHHIDYSCTYKGGWTLNMIDAADLIFRRNTIHTTGASECLKAGRRNLIELNNISQTGFLQNDGALIQVSVKQQDQSETRYNWVHNSVKQGLRFDNSNKPNSPWGENGSMHHNVAWKTDRVFYKGDRHFIYNNLIFDSHLNDLIISCDTIIQGWNYKTITRNNLTNKFSGSRTKPLADFPVPGIVDHNWAGCIENSDVRSQLRDPDNLDFRPKKGADIVDAGALIEGKKIHYIGKMADIGPYEYGAETYWIPGFQAEHASTPVPPDDALAVKADADLMWLAAYKSQAHKVYFGTEKAAVEEANEEAQEFKGIFENNIFSPGQLDANHVYYWRVDASRDGKISKGKVWQFTVE